jgi:hypothetical protein
MSNRGSLATEQRTNDERKINPFSKSKSKLCCNWRSVSLSVLVSSPSWGSWPDVSFYTKVTVQSMWGALSDERSGLSFVSNIKSIVSMYTHLQGYTQYLLQCTIYTRPLSVQAQYMNSFFSGRLLIQSSGNRGECLLLLWWHGKRLPYQVSLYKIVSP